MVGALDLNVLNGTTQDAQRGEKLLTFIGGHVRIGRTMEQKQRSVDLVCIEQSRLLHIQVWVVPRIGAVLCGFAVSMSPISATPIRGNVRNTGMTHRRGENVGARLEILSHKATIACAHATHLLGLDIRMRSHKGLRGFDDIIARTLSPGIDVTRCKLLAETNRTGRFES